MSPNTKHVLAFSPNDGKLFALVDEQGILRIWDTEANSLKQEFVPNLHLAGSCTCIAWVPIASGLTKPRKSQSADGEKYYLALGTLQGKVSLYSLAEGKIERTLKGECHDGPITSIVYDNAGHLYTVGQDCELLVWSLAQEQRIDAWNVGPEKPKYIAYMPRSHSLVIGSRQIKVYDIKTKELQETFTGHATEINGMCEITSKDNVEYAITTAKMERVICFWKLQKKGRNKASTCTLLMEDQANCLSCELQDDGQLRVAGVTRNGNIHIYLLNVDSLSADKFIKPKVSLQIASDGGGTVEPIHALAARFVHDHHSHEILFGYGNHRVLQFERFTPNYAEKLNVIVRTDPKKLYGSKKRKEKLGTESALKIQLPNVDFKNVEYNSAIMSKKKRENDVTIEARLENLSIDTLNLDNTDKIQTKSKTQLLMQALNSQDRTMLNAVLKIKDSDVVKLTLEHLPVNFVHLLLDELTERIQGNHEDLRSALLWMRMLSFTHTSVLISDDKDDLRDKLSICLGIAEQRMQCLYEALQLTGRMKLIVNQMKRSANIPLDDIGVIMMTDQSMQDNENKGLENSSENSEKDWSDLEEEKVPQLRDDNLDHNNTEAAAEADYESKDECDDMEASDIESSDA